MGLNRLDRHAVDRNRTSSVSLDTSIGLGNRPSLPYKALVNSVGVTIMRQILPSSPSYLSHATLS